MTSIHSNLAALRSLRGLTQEKVAKDLGITRQTVHNIEKDYKIPSLEIALKLAKYFEVDVEQMFILDPEIKQPQKSAK